MTTEAEKVLGTPQKHLQKHKFQYGLGMRRIFSSILKEKFTGRL
jgi:hypothetical protein